MNLIKKLVYLYLLILVFGCSNTKNTVSLHGELYSDNTGKTTLKVLTYNVLTGFQKDAKQADHFVGWANEQEADVIGFQELSTFTQDSLERLAKRYGHRYAVLHRGNGSPIGITSRYPFVAVERMSGDMHHGSIYAQTKGVHFFVTHLSPFSYEKCQQEIQSILIKAAKIPENEKIIIMGDLNSFSPADSVQYGHRRFAVIQRLEDGGFTDVFRQVNQTFENSFPTEKYVYKSKTANRIDYIFANRLVIEDVVYSKFIKDSTTHTLSDHYPLMAEFKLLKK